MFPESGTDASKIQNFPVSTVDPTNGQVLTYNSTTEQWEPKAGDSGGSSDWGQIGGTLSAQTDLQTALDGKQASGSYAAASHSHAYSAITDKPTTFAPVIGSGAGDAVAGNDSRLSDSRTPTSHAHGNLSNGGLIGTTANLPLKTGTGGIVEAGAFGAGATDFAAGNDSRLSDARVPTAAGLASVTDAATSKATPVDADEVPLADSAASFGLKKLTWANIKATLKTYFDTLYTLTLLGGVPTSRTVGGVDLSANRSVSDIGAEKKGAAIAAAIVFGG